MKSTLLNAKLLFTNKLFRKYGLNNEQKMKVVEQFDRASNLREVKLVYSTLGESFGTGLEKMKLMNLKVLLQNQLHLPNLKKK